MSRNVLPNVLVIVAALALVAVLVALFLWISRTDATEPRLTATAVMVSESGADVGAVAFHQEGDRVLVMVDVHGLAPGGHSITVHAVGACTPDFAAAGDHFEAGQGGWGFVHPNWKGEPKYGEHGGDLPNIYADDDGSARADFITDGFTLLAGEDHSLFDEDGSSIVVHEKPQDYGEHEGDTGARVACGVIVLP